MTDSRNVGENAAVVRGFLAAFLSGQMDIVLEALDADAEAVQPPSLPYGGTYRGREGFLDMAGKLGDTWDFSDASAEPRCFELDDGRVLVQAQFDAVATATGARFYAPFVELYTVEDSKITRIEVFTDTAAAVDALRE